MKKHGITMAILAIALSGAAFAAEEEHNNGQDFTKPLTRFDVRYQYERVNIEEHNNDFLTLRADKPLPVAKDWLLSTRLDLPLVLTNVKSPDNIGGVYKAGLSDMLAQAVFINTVNEEIAWGFGTQLILPTATQDEMGSGKYQLLPMTGVRFSLPSIGKGDWIALLARYDYDFAGKSDRSHISVLQFAPTVNFSLPNYWFIDLYPSMDIKYNCSAVRTGDSGRWFVPFDIMAGRMLSKKLVASLEVGVPIIKDYNVYDFKTEARLGYFF